jgi:hypothetical protein
MATPIFSTLGNERALASARRALDCYAGTEPGAAGTDRTHDGGPAVLAALAAGAGVAGQGLFDRVLQRWLAGLPDDSRYVGAFEGLAGFVAGLHAAGPLHERLRPLATLVGESLATWSTSGALHTDRVVWADYDLISGPAGVVLCLATADAAVGRAGPAAGHLAALCDRPDLRRLRLNDDGGDPRRSWNVGRVNTGLGHGVTGVAAALRVAVEALPGGERFAAPLRRVCDWLVRESYVDDNGMVCWPPAGLDGQPPSRHPTRRQAWCYGTPGIAWTLWDAGRVLADDRVQDFARQAMRSFCDVFDEGRHLDPEPVDATLGVCHGAAGTLAIADAFARHAALPSAAVLRERLGGYLLDRLTDVDELAVRDLSMLTGAGGILSVLLLDSAADRCWLNQLALR